MTALVIALLLHGQPARPGNLETADGYYCATSRYLAYETLLHDSPAAHLLHVVPLEKSTDARPELRIDIDVEPTRRVRCAGAAITLQGEARSTTVRLDLDRWQAAIAPEPSNVQGTGPWQTTRLWGNGSWSRTAHQQIALRRFDDATSVLLDITRLSTGGAECESEAGARLVWVNGHGREIQSRTLFLRHLSCRREGVTGGPTFDDCSPQPGRWVHRFSGRVAADQPYEHTVGSFRFALAPEGRFGWAIRVKPLREDRDLTSLLPLHGPSSRDISPSTPAMPSATSIAHPFNFHPEARRNIVYSDDAITMLVDDLRLRSYGKGRLTIDRYSLAQAADGQSQFAWIAFTVCMSWPRQALRLPERAAYFFFAAVKRPDIMSP